MATGWLFGYGDGHRVTEDEVRHRLEQVPLMVAPAPGCMVCTEDSCDVEAA